MKGIYLGTIKRVLKKEEYRWINNITRGQEIIKNYDKWRIKSKWLKRNIEFGELRLMTNKE